jgi:diguanylate cyclase (GGDEF)-like protein
VDVSAVDRVLEPPDELAAQRSRRALPRQRRTGPLAEPEREQYELAMDQYEVQLAEYRARLEEYAAQLEAAHHDGLTGTWLRHAGRQLLDEELMRSARNDTPLSIAFVDVDGLKARNDELGHAAGDRALVAVARALLAGLRGYDHVVRWGGDEFLCVLPGLTAAEAERRLQQARRDLARGPAGLGISVGVAERHAGESVEDLVARADRALYLSRGRSLRR